MGVKLVKDSKYNTISVLDMSDGDIAEIISWTNKQYVGTIVQRYINVLITVGSSSGKAWTGIFDIDKNSSAAADCRVRLLVPGEKIEIT